VLDTHQRDLADLAGRRAAHRHDDHRNAGIEKGVGLGPSRALVRVDLVP
jgi:hypothetical protein